MQKKGKIFIISAPSGAGKTSLIKEVINRLKNQYDISKVMTYTSRTARDGEINNKDYCFLSHDEFENKMKKNFFLETTTYNGKLYGSPATILPDAELGKNLIIIIDIDGAKSLKKLIHDATLIWINAPSIKELKRRLLKRGEESANQIEKRIQIAQEEMKEAHKARLFDYTVVNEVFEQTVAEIITIIKTQIESLK